MSNQAVWAIVPAAGIGSRMQADRPKQYLQLDGKTVIEHTLQRLASHPRIKGIVVAIAFTYLIIFPWLMTFSGDDPKSNRF